MMLQVQPSHAHAAHHDNLQPSNSMRLEIEPVGRSTQHQHDCNSYSEVLCKSSLLLLSDIALTEDTCSLISSNSLQQLDELEKVESELSQSQEVVTPRSPTPLHKCLVMSKNECGSATTKHVRFGNVEIQTYPPILGDNPACMSGAPLSIGWDCESIAHYGSLEEYDDWRDSDFSSSIGIDTVNCRPSPRPRRRCSSELQLSAYARRQILKRFAGARNQEILQVTKDIQKIQRQRGRSRKFGFLSDPLLEVCEGVRSVFVSSHSYTKTKGQ
jgi:hypothetical protein